MISIAENTVNLVVPVGTLENLLELQTALLLLIRCQNPNETLDPSHVGSIAALLQETLFDSDQMTRIEALLKSTAQAA